MWQPNDYIHMGIDQRIQTARNQKKMPQFQPAEIIGVTKSVRDQWERGVTRPSMEKLSLLAVALDVHFEWLVPDAGMVNYPAD